MAESTQLVEGMVVALAIQLRYDGQVVATGSLAWRDSITLTSFDALIELGWTSAAVELRSVSEEDRVHWSVWGELDPERALAFFDETKRLGSVEPFEIPIDWEAAPNPRGARVPRRRTSDPQ